MLMRSWFFLCVLVFLVSGHTAMLPAQMSAAPTLPGLHVLAEANAVSLSWHLAPEMAETVETVEYGGYALPAELVPLTMVHNQPIDLQIDQIQAQPWNGELTRVAAPVPQTADGTRRPDLIGTAPSVLPNQPVIVLREGVMRGERLVVLMISPFFQRAGAVYQATSFEATVSDAVPLTRQPAALQSPFFDRTETSDQAEQTSTSVAVSDYRIWFPLIQYVQDARLSLRPPNAAAAQTALKIEVSQAGMQRISGDMLAANGFDLQNLDPSVLQIWHADGPVPLEERGTEDGRLDPSDELRFYAPEPGDRWNAADIYWLTSISTRGSRIGERLVAPQSAPLVGVARTQGSWYQPILYDSTLPGRDKDHWYSAHLRTGPGQGPAIQSVALQQSLPVASGQSRITVSGSAYTVGPHRLEVLMGSEVQSVSWTGVGEWTHQLFFSHLPQPRMEIRLQPDAGFSGIEIDRVAWDIPVQLNASGRGLLFHTDAGLYQYRIEAVASGSTLYDISDPAKPVRLVVPPNPTFDFQDGPEAHAYLLSGDGTLHTPRVHMHTPVDMAVPLNVDLIYIAPAPFHAALVPLAEQRRAQGYRVALVDVQAIYDAWSFGQVSPEAIRSFLRYAYASWASQPVAVTLVGDGTSDPQNYKGFNNPNWIPPYLAYVDPWLGETACETCYVQLDGVSALHDILPDMLIGRLPVKTVAELNTVVAKIVTYETGDATASWRNRAIYLTDNPFEANGQPDPASNFIADADASIALQPASLTIERLSYDPSPDHTTAPWREPDHVRARDRTIALLNQGAGIVTFFGHSHQWQWAVTNPNQNPSHLIELYEVDWLSNGDRLPVVLAMSCLSSAFQEPTGSGTTIDERLVLHATGGAVAVWGAAGQGVAYGHRSLQQGFYQALWRSAPPSHATLGSLTQAGYTELFLRGRCCESSIRTYVLLGDALTWVRVGT